VPTAAAITAALGPLVGRRREVEQLCALLEDNRLVTVTGAGGSGKTRIALEVVGRVAGDTAFVQLAPLRDPSLVAAAIAQELGLAGTGAEEALFEALPSRGLLLCLDNFEHVVDAAPFVSQLLATAPGLRILTTSRTSLRLTGEQEYPLAPLAAREAVEFFTVRARGFRPAFEPDEAVVEICRRLDGLPLALELAAARVKLLSPGQILDRLERRLPLLSGGLRDVPERHRTLRAAIDWSYQLLTPEEQLLFARLSVFPGGCTLEAAEAVDEAGADTLEAVASLIDKSLLRRQESDDEPRFRMLETLRDYAQERLEEQGLAGEVRSRQASYYVQLAERSQVEMMEAGGYSRWVAVLRSELDNLEAVVYWGIEHEPEAALRTLAACGSRVFHLAPARVSAWLDAALAVTSSVELSLAAAVLRTGGFTHLVVRDLPRAEELLLEAVTLRDQLGEQGEAARARALLSTVYAHTGRPDLARGTAERAVLDARASGDDHILLMVLANVAGSMSVIDDYPRARAALEEVIPLAERRGSWGSLFVARINLGSMLLRQDPAQAADVFRAALAHAAFVADTQVLHARDGIAMATLLSGDPEGARREFAGYIETARDVGRSAEIQSAVAGLMGVSSAVGDAAAAARLAGARRAIAPTVTWPSYLQPFVDASRAALGEEEWRRLEAEGSELPLDDVIAPVLEAGKAGEAVRRAFLFTDIVSSTQLLELIGDAAWGSLVFWHDRTLRALFEAYGGDEVDHAGDGFFVAFADARQAVACATAIQRSLADHRHASGFAPEVRIGVHEAVATEGGDGYQGLGVHTAARIASSAVGGEVVVSVATAEAAGAAMLGEPVDVALKGLAEPIRVVRLAWRPDTVARPV
jgi:predicted ATPase/class 3 adenylate cyclase